MNLQMHWEIEREGGGDPTERVTTHWLWVCNEATEYYVRKVGFDEWECGGPDFSYYCYSWRAGRKEIEAKYQRMIEKENAA